MKRTHLFERRYFLPSEHGAWIWWLGPAFLGGAAAGRWSGHLLTLLVAMFAAFLIRQPITLFVKTLSNRRGQHERRPAVFWTIVLGGVALSAFLVLLAAGFGRLAWLLLPGALVFAWHLRLVSIRGERGQRGIEIVGAGVLALAAPAAYWVAGGPSAGLAWTLWGVAWLQSAASIVLVYQRLSERRLDEPGDLYQRMQRSARSLAYHTFNVLVSLLASLWMDLPLALPLASTLMWLDAVDALRVPAVGLKPTAIGLRQLAASLSFMFLVGLGFLVG